MLPYLPDEPCPPSDRYGTRQAELHAHIGTLYDKMHDMRQEIAELRDILAEAMTVIAAFSP